MRACTPTLLILFLAACGSGGEREPTAVEFGRPSTLLLKVYRSIIPLSKQLVEHGTHHRLAQPVDQHGHQAGPARLVAGAQSRTVVAVEIFVKEDVIAPVGITLEHLNAAVNRPFAGQKAGHPTAL